jgi:autotransporter-associated beta strand protein
MKRHPFITGSWFAALATAVTLIGSEPAVFAATTGTWAGNGASGSWSDTGNWSGGTIPGSTSSTTNGDTALFTLAAPTYGTSSNPVVIDLGRNLEFITFDLNAAAYVVGSTTGSPLVLTAGGTLQNTATLVSGNTKTVNAPLTLEGNYTIADNSGGSALIIGGAITAAGNSTLTLSGNNTSTSNVLSGILAPGAGTLALTKSGAGFWGINGINTNYAGTTTLNNGTLSLNNALALGTQTTITLSGGALAASTPLTALNALTDNFNVMTNGGTSTAIFADVGGSNSITTSGSLTFNGTAAAPNIFTNNLTTGNTFTVTGTTYLANNGTTTGEAIFDGAGATSLSTINGGPGSHGGIASILDYYGSGTLTLNGANNSTGAQYLLGGTTALSEASGPNLNSSGALVLGSNLQLNGTGVTETVASTTLAATGSTPVGTNTAASISGNSSDTINLGALTGGFSTSTILFENPSSSVSVAYTTSASGATSATPGETAYFGGWAIASTGSGSSETYDFATDLTASTGGTETAIVGYPQADYNVLTAGGGAPSGGGVELYTDTTGATLNNGNYGDIGSLKIDTGTSTLAGILNFNRGSAPLVWYGGAVLYTGTGGANFTIEGNLWFELLGSVPTAYYIDQYGSGSLTIASVIDADAYYTYNQNAIASVYGAAKGAIIKSGPGKLILTAANNYVGNTYIDQGTLSISSDSNLGGISGDLTVTSATNGSTSVTVTGVAGSLDLVGASLLGSTVSSITSNSGGSNATDVLVLSSSYTGTTINSTTNPSGVTYAYANGTQSSLNLDGTLEASATLTLGESYTDASTGTVSASRPVYLGVDGGTFQVDSNTSTSAPYTLTVPGVIAAGGLTGVTNDVSLTKTGTGTLVLSGANTYAGGTVVSAGTLFANTPTGSSTGQGGVTVASGATLGGTGIIAPNGLSAASYGNVPDASVTVSGTLAPGGVQTAGSAPNGNLTLTANATYSPVVLNLLTNATLKFALGTNLGSNASSELVLSLNLPGEVVFNNNVISINDLTSGNLSGTYVLFAPTTANTTGSDYAGLTLNSNNVITGGLSLAPSFTGTSALYSNSVLYLDSATGDIDIAVPEPKTFALLLIGVAVLFHQRRKFRNQA